MAIGPGRYDALADYCIKASDADAVVVIVFKGTLGNGFTMRGKMGADFEIALRSLEAMDMLPGVLRRVADTIEKDGNRKI